ncbi:low quality protein: dynein assembly factor axonemal [Plasmopara halstedii]|uniref:Low quality protein: dynein assembly factor axonemal n=1 Tax=Plasmopara halstedii TaxID=4781 RepID=A0A0P1AKH6_PLAHL|nr:low quality protein: dynein assembly factor axonemal [Plasmopara halstedii]CEG41609.1 low quality protein: dynein assembly factor axonemal [Plasmopara halstedii]|eukprot:XP_024577978.1 low quality protein: dynein assembly factor axonemal [Plasmopara halstedii]
MEMDKKVLKKICKDNDLYVTPAINDKLYLHYKGFRSIKNLEEYTGLKALWLEGNGLTQIEGLENQKELRTLYLHENLIQKIEGLGSQLLLDTLNLSQNQVSCIENLDHLKHLTSLALKGNYLTSAKDIAHVLRVPSLSVLDIQSNRISDVEIVDILARLPKLKVLYLQGNEVVKHIKQYRKTMIYRCRKLKYLDDRPVFDDERRRVEAWGKALEASSGDMKLAQEAERREMDAIRREKKERDDRNFLYFEQMMIEGRRKRQEDEKRRSIAETPEQRTEEFNIFSGEKVIPVQDCALLQQEREKRWESVVNAPAERVSNADIATNENEGNIEDDYGTISNKITAAEAIPVDMKRMEVLHQCASLGAATTSSENSLVNTLFQVSEGIRASSAPEAPTKSIMLHIDSSSSDQINSAMQADAPLTPSSAVTLPPAPIANTLAASLSKTGEAKDTNDVQSSQKIKQEAPLTHSSMTDEYLLPNPSPVKQTVWVEQATRIMPPLPPPTHTELNELD